MTREKDVIDELERLHAATTNGPWRARVDAPNYVATGHGDEFAHVAKAHNTNDAAFIVAAHNHLPALLAYVRAQEELEAAVCRYIRGQQNPRGPFAGAIDRDAIFASLAALDAARARLNGESK